MRDQRDRELVHPRISRERSGGQFRKLAVIAAREAFPHLADVLLDDVVVVEQPVARRSHFAAAVRRIEQSAMGAGENAPRTVQPREQRGLPAPPSGEPLRLGEGLRPLGQALGAEEVTANRAGQHRLVRVRPAAKESRYGAGKFEGGDGDALGGVSWRSRVRADASLTGT